MNKTNEIFEGEDPLLFARQYLQNFQSLVVNYEEMTARLEQVELRNKELEQENEQLRKERQKADEWSSRVTYENVVELIASYEDPAQRDLTRKFIELLVKRDTARQLRRDVKNKREELERVDGIESEMRNAMKGNVTMNNPTFNAPLYGISGNRNVNLREPDYGKEG